MRDIQAAQQAATEAYHAKRLEFIEKAKSARELGLDPIQFSKDSGIQIQSVRRRLIRAGLPELASYFKKVNM